MLETTAIIVLVLGITIFFLFRKKRPVLSETEKKLIGNLWEGVLKISDPGARVLEAEKVLHTVWKKLGADESFGETLKRIGKTLPNEQSLWNAHKLRNRIAHEPGITVTPREADQAVAAFGKVVAVHLK